MRKSELKQIIREDINHILKEERGINDSVRIASGEIYDYIVHDYKRKVKALGGTRDFVRVEGSFKYEMKSYDNRTKVPKKPISVSYYIYDFKDKPTYQRYFDNRQNDEENLFRTSTSVSNGRIVNFLNICRVSVAGNMDLAKLYDDIQHEMNHIFQQVNKGGFYNFRKEYGVAGGYYSSKNQDEYSLATIAYLSNTTEQDSIANGLYGYLSQKGVLRPVYADFKNSEAVEFLTRLNNSVAYVKANRNNGPLVSIVKKDFEPLGWDMKKFIRSGEKAIVDLTRKIARVIDKYRDDVQRKTPYRENMPANGSYGGGFTV